MFLPNKCKQIDWNNCIQAQSSNGNFSQYFASNAIETFRENDAICIKKNGQQLRVSGNDIVVVNDCIYVDGKKIDI